MPSKTLSPPGSSMESDGTQTPGIFASKCTRYGGHDFVIFSDFDGTIFMQDTGHILFDHHGCGSIRRQELDEEIKTGERSFKAVSEDMWGSLNISFEDGFAVMKEKLEIDPDFTSFHEFCMVNEIPFNVISAGLKPVLRQVLDFFLGEYQSSHIDIIANDAAISTDGSVWKPIWRHDTDLGHDKAASLQEYKAIASSESDDGSIPMIIFIGDGISDLPAATEADVLFARRGLRLEEYCIENEIPYIPFDTFADIQGEVEKRIISGGRPRLNTTGPVFTACTAGSRHHGPEVKSETRPGFWRQTGTAGRQKPACNISAPIRA